MLIAGVAVFIAGRAPAAPAFHGAYIADDFARMMKLLSLVSAGCAIVMSLSRARAEKLDQFEYPVLIVLATLGMMAM
ncbi:hypothetical protein J8J27_31920, partial [Mycobacterium tuberculosis]|nr:hypothetical protein [Mycobacterium tuberculosis]